MIFKSIFVISTLLIVAEAAAMIDSTKYLTEVRKDFPKPANTEEHWEKNDHATKNQNVVTDTPDLKRTTNTDIDVQTGTKSNEFIHHNDNELGHEMKTDRNSATHVHSKGTRTVKSHTPTEMYQSKAHLESDTRNDNNSAARDQSLRDGNLHVEEENNRQVHNEHLSGAHISTEQPDYDHAKGEKEIYDDTQSDYTNQHTDTTKRTINKPNGKIQITDTNDVRNKFKHDTHSTKQKNIELAPDKTTKSFLKKNTEDINDNTTTTGKTYIVRDTPFSTLNIIDENKEENNNNERIVHENSVKFVSDNKGTSTIILEKTNKDIVDDTIENNSILTVEKTPKSAKAPTLQVKIASSTLEEQHLRMNENQDKQVHTESPTEKKVITYHNESTSKYDFNPIPTEEEDGDDDEDTEDENNDEHQVQETSEQTESGNKDSGYVASSGDNKNVTPKKSDQTSDNEEIKKPDNGPNGKPENINKQQTETPENTKPTSKNEEIKKTDGPSEKQETSSKQQDGVVEQAEKNVNKNADNNETSGSNVVVIPISII